MGFNMCSEIGEKFFVPCYNCQNGYYSGNLELFLIHDSKVIDRRDISNFVKDEIY